LPGLGLFIPITSHVKAYPFEVLIDHDFVSGAMLCDQVKSLDWKARSAQYVMTISQA
jgi:mRNA interferase MazF